MDNGGCLYIEGSNVGNDHRTTTFFGYLGAGFVNIGSVNAIDSIIGVSGTFSAPNEFIFPSGDPDYRVDELSAGNGTVFLTSQDGKGRAVFYEGLTHRAICSSAILGAYHDGEYTNTKASLMERYVNYLMGSTAPDIWVSHDIVDFGLQYIDYEAIIPLYIQNLGFSDLDISSLYISGECFSIDSDPPYTLISGGEQVLPISFQSSETGTYAGTITIISSDPDEDSLVINLTAECLQPPVAGYSADELYAYVDLDNVAQRVLTINNTGNSDLSFSINLVEPDVLGSYAIPRSNSGYEDIILSKGESDYREGPPVVCGSGGPDMFGYTWIDSNEPNGPEFEWFNISDIGINSGLYGDDGSVVVGLPFTFEFYGEPKTSVRISTNGYLTFGSVGNTYSNDPIPDADEPNDLIAPFWDDLHQQDGINYYYYDEDNNRFIIQYSNWGFYNGSGLVTFQVHLCQNGSIFYYYYSMSGTLSSATIGIENGNGSDGLQVAFNTNYIANGLVVRINSGPSWLSVDIETGIIAPGSSTDVTFTFDARGIPVGFYEANIVITTNDPAAPEKIIPATMAAGTSEIDDEPLPFNTELIGNYPNPFNPVTTIGYNLAVKGHVNIEVFNILGQKTITLVDEIKNAGNHEVKWNADVSSGMYFYRMTTSNYSGMKKMLLLK